MEKGAHSSMLLVNVQIYAMPVKRPEVHHQAIRKAMFSLKLSEKGLLQAFPPASGNS